MKLDFRKIISDYIKNNKDSIKKISALALMTAMGCFISFHAGRHMGSSQDTVSDTSEDTGNESSSPTDSTLDGAPYFEFPPYASPSDATPSNARIMSPELLNLAFIYEDGTGSLLPSDSFAGRLYGQLADMDAEWSSGIYDLYHYTPGRLASQMGIPVQAVTTASGVIPEFRNVNVLFLDGDGQAMGGVTNARSIVAMANTLHYYGILNNMEQMEAYIRRMWNGSHHYSVHMGNIYYCDGSCRDTAASQDGDGEPETAASDGLSETAGPEELSETVGPEESDSAAGTEGAQSSGTSCPGHMDFSVSITVKGITEHNGLFKEDPLTAGTSGPSGWKGWNETSMGWVRSLCGQDWQEEYGLNTADLFIRSPLTSAEIDIYMSLVPEDTSQMKKDFVRYALSSVGKIPYYWGGKPASPGYSGNGFGAVVSPDADGRFLGGLDCSGWINWAYWSVTGRGLGAEGTGTLINSGTAVTKSQLVPGDICIRTGPSAHVVIFLGWAAGGQMMCIQETSGSVNNVEVGITTPDWQSYRRIID